MKENISVCRVEEGQIVNSASFTGVCVRDEEVINSSGNGYINFYVGEGDKVANAGNIYLLSPEAPENQAGTSEGGVMAFPPEITAKSAIRFLVFSKNYSNSSFSQIYSLRYNLQSLSTEMRALKKSKNLKAIPPAERLCRPPRAELFPTVMMAMRI